jgi:stage III sporulation protein SpoIIIAA
MQEMKITDDLDVLLDVLPPSIVDALQKIGRFHELIEVVMDLGRQPEARYVSEKLGSEEQILREGEVTGDDIDYIVERIGEFDDDNRAGITRTLHRISGIRNRRGAVVGLTCRVGRAVYGTLDIIEDIISTGKSILLLGRPGVGKTTMLREAARVLAETKRVVIVDTSNEIGGDGDIPHPAVGRARRMQVSTPSLQHEVMIEAVENHNPQVIVIDEIGREQEAEAARTIAERGVQLIGTAHGQTIDNLMINPTLNDLIGGIESVTLSDEEARRRGTQKTVLERRSPPTFDVLVEIRDRYRLLVHHNVSEAVDSLLRDKMPLAEVREFADGEVKRTPVRLTKRDGPSGDTGEQREGPVRRTRRSAANENVPTVDDIFRLQKPDVMGMNAASEARKPEYAPVAVPSAEGDDDDSYEAESKDSYDELPASMKGKVMRLFAFGIPKHRLKQAVRNLSVPAEMVDSVDDADVLITSKSYYRQRPRIITDAEHNNVPIYVLRSNSSAQMESCLADLFSIDSAEAVPYEQAMEETEAAIKRVLAGDRLIDLSPQNAFIRRQQHERARAANLVSHSYGKEPIRHVRIFRD